MNENEAQRLERQIAEVKARYIGADGEALVCLSQAPNGKPTRLHEREWLIVRTPFFQERFGDWVSAILIEMAERVWANDYAHRRFNFPASQKLTEKLREFFGNEVKQVAITSNEIQHIRKKHGANENKRNQADIMPNDIALIPFVINEFDEAWLDRKDKYGNRGVVFSKKINGDAYSVGYERGENKAQVITFWQKNKRASDAVAPDKTSETVPPKQFLFALSVHLRFLR
ncbi:hypothetical protein FACS1894139_14590 [Planctomycetales bacterium]|nr:hypothetical protein FACS1894107_12210 [Planctomycetales bacterium]GHT00037.1 hypothetical protein FACS1894108_11220 [Planctomycetales bacterium]GHT07113.1 hypothetical protein FACS1894139_14590 [Planctomycetales bacterium]